MERLRQKAEQLNIRLDDNQLEQFRMYYEMLVEKNKVMNLTAITEFEEVLDKHFIDSILLGTVMELKWNSSVIDVGTGAGFPGIPLKIVYPHLRITLLDSLNKRVNFLNEVIHGLELTDINAIHSRAEDGARNPLYREAFDLCVSRAVANLSTLSEYCLPFVKQSGYFVSYKSSQIQAELEQAERAVSVLGGKLESVQSVTLPESDIIRQFVCIRKIKSTPKAYPRKAGTAAKQPII
ncbi:MAG: 16S rRNA (guanine(527)-N(7))-methyltransferase RsmG [Bacteroides sp.]|nr:16S rRNA (guanine(527)-N(7))-methyltransferase RsmG [Bacteroides sp.]MCM1549710.1 16S rRNA (guanine(527)-N(7))-methyltransferase RsmG [Clostridium sp.]